jgi:hypothetical protein
MAGQTGAEELEKEYIFTLSASVPAMVRRLKEQAE